MDYINKQIQEEWIVVELQVIKSIEEVTLPFLSTN